MNDNTDKTGFQQLAQELNSTPSTPIPHTDIIQDTWDDAMDQVQKEQERIYARHSAENEKRFSTRINKFFHREKTQLGY